MHTLNRMLCTLCLITLSLAGCSGGGGDESALNYDGELSLAELYTYDVRSDSDQILECSVMYLDGVSSCDIADIVPLGVEVSGDIAIDDVLGRLVVSHDWMAESFIAALEEIDDQNLLNLFKAVNTVVFSYETAGSFYHPLTASIYIDPRYLWRNSDEWDTIYQDDDSDDASEYELQFYPIFRYIDAATSDYTIWSNNYSSLYNSRTTAQIAPGLYRVLAHELGHANDYLPPEELSALGSSGTIYYDYMSFYPRVHDELNDIYPLSSDLLFEAADVYYSDAEMTDLIRATTGADLGLEFDGDGAVYLYSYKVDSEDIAMMFEAMMMYKRYNSVMDVAYLSVPASEDSVCDDYLVEWGQRNRLAESYVNQRVEFVADRLISEDYALGLAAITEVPIYMEAESGWCSSRTETAAADGSDLRSTEAVRESQVVHDFSDDSGVERYSPVREFE